MFGATHSWSNTVRSICFELYKMGHDLYITSTDGYSLAPKEMSHFYGKDTDNADIDFCYTLPKNFKRWFSPSSKLKLAIFNWESTVIPPEWVEFLSNADYILPSSHSVRQIFIENKWPKEKLIVLPLGVDWNNFRNAGPMDIGGLNSFRFLNISIPHHRKNLDILFDAYYSEFKQDDNVSLIIKSSFDKPKNRFECDLSNVISVAQKKHGGKILPKVHIIAERLMDIAPLYKSANCLVSASSFEGFGLPMLEALAAGIQVIAPRASGQLDFLNDNNAFLIDTSKIRAGEKYQYWRPNNDSFTFLPKTGDLATNMRAVFSGGKKDPSNLLEDKFSWENSAKGILKIYENTI